MEANSEIAWTGEVNPNLKKSLPPPNHSTPFPNSSSDDEEFDNDIITKDNRPRGKTATEVTYRPEFVPRPKPKATDIKPTPMMLCKESPSNSDDDSFFSCPNNSDGDDENIFRLEREEGSSLFNEAKRKITKIRTGKTFNSNHHFSKDYLSTCNDTINTTTNIIDKRLSTQQRPSAKKSIWQKYINLEESLLPQQYQLRNSMKLGNYSLLRILEAAANDSSQKKIIKESA